MSRIPTNNTTSFLEKMFKKYREIEDQKSPIFNFHIHVEMCDLRYNPDGYNSLYLLSPFYSMVVKVPTDGQSNVNTSSKIEKTLLHEITKKPYKGINIIKHPRFEINLEEQNITLLRSLIDYILAGDARITLEWVKPIQDIIIEKETIKRKVKSKKSVNGFGNVNPGELRYTGDVNEESPAEWVVPRTHRSTKISNRDIGVKDLLVEPTKVNSINDFDHYINYISYPKFKEYSNKLYATAGVTPQLEDYSAPTPPLIDKHKERIFKQRIDALKKLKTVISDESYMEKIHDSNL